MIKPRIFVDPYWIQQFGDLNHSGNCQNRTASLFCATNTFRGGHNCAVDYDDTQVVGQQFGHKCGPKGSFDTPLTPYDAKFRAGSVLLASSPSKANFTCQKTNIQFSISRKHFRWKVCFGCARTSLRSRELNWSPRRPGEFQIRAPGPICFRLVSSWSSSEITQ